MGWPHYSRADGRPPRISQGAGVRPRGAAAGQARDAHAGIPFNDGRVMRSAAPAAVIPQRGSAGKVQRFLLLAGDGSVCAISLENRVIDHRAVLAYTGRHLTFGRSWPGHTIGMIRLRSSLGRSIQRVGRAMGSRDRADTDEPRTPVLWPRPRVSECVSNAPDTPSPSCQGNLPGGQARARELAAGMGNPPALPRHQNRLRRNPASSAY